MPKVRLAAVTHIASDKVSLSFLFLTSCDRLIDCGGKNISWALAFFFSPEIVFAFPDPANDV